MQRGELERTVGRRLAAAMERFGLEVVAAAPVTALPTRRSPRASYRLELSDGGSLKARRMRHPRKAERMKTILAELGDERFSRVLFAEHDVLIEEWVSGTPLSELDPDGAHVGTCAAILGSLHGHRELGGRRLHVPRSTGRALLRLERGVERLVREGELEKERGARALELARASRPKTAPVGLIHGDFCPENIVLDRAGALRVVDNESLRVDHLDYDLARTWLRWPMPGGEWSAFLASYSAYREPPAPEAFSFWQLAAIVKSAAKRLAWRTSGIDVAVRRLGEVLGGD